MRDAAEKIAQALRAARDEQSLRARLAAIVQRKRLSDVCVGVWIDGREMMLRAGYDAAASAAVDIAPAADAAVAAGCLGKLLTAGLIGAAVESGRIGWSDSIAAILGETVPQLQHVRGVTVRHLLDHTHGLDGYALTQLPHDADGWIDAAALCAALTAPPLCAPGRMYSYGNVGAWLAAAVLERVHAVRYATLLSAYTSYAADGDAYTAVCPATGAELALSVAQWLAFARHSLTRLGAANANADEQIALPGWHPTERAILRGWKAFGEGWFGHNAHLPASSAVLRVHPAYDLALLVAARDQNGAVFAASGVFGDLLPEFRNLRPPRLLTGADAAQLDLAPHVARYRQAHSGVEVDVGPDASLRLSVLAQTPDGTASPPRRLRPTEQGVFLAESGGGADFLFVQFLADAAAHTSAYLWNGRQLWRRDGVPS